MAFFIYIHDWHHIAKFFNKAASCNGFLCLYLSDKGVQILTQHDTYDPQIITYDMKGGALDKHTINTILT
jgi:hypothetical protein